VSEPELPTLRISDADRERTATDLARARAEGRLTLEELSQRLDLVYAAKTQTELEPLTSDLPALPDPGRRTTSWIVSILGGSRRAGRWRAADRIRVIAFLGGVDLDLSQAIVTGPDIRLTCFALFGGIDVIVPRGVDVELTGFSLIGGRDLEIGDEPARPGTPVVHVRAFTLLGGISVGNPPEKRL
jgi:hypothetical protein